jgi:hypothetical protein
MELLTDQELDELDRVVDAAVPSLPLLSRRRDVALIHLLRFHESYMVGNASTPNRGERDNATGHANDGMNNAVQWIFQYCPINRSAPNLTFDEQAYLEAEALHRTAIEYSKVWDLMSLMRRGHINGCKEDDKTIRLTFSSNFNREMSMATGAIAAPYGPVLSGPLVTPEVSQDILDSVSIQEIEPQLSYQVPDGLFNRLFDRTHRMTAEPWDMNPDWDLGGYTIAQLRKFRVTIDTLCVIHGQISRRLGDPRTILGSIIKYHSRSIWERILTKRSKLSQEVVTTILSDLIYDPALYGLGKKQPHITFHPFFPLGNNTIAVSNWLVHVSNVERNVWDLVSIKRPQLHSRLRNLKEASWIKELQQKTQTLGLKIYPTIEFEYNGQRSDLDALIIDPLSRFGLVCQLKWLTQPGRVSSVFYNDNEIKKGITQAQLALGWVRSNPALLSQRTGLSLGDLNGYEFQPLVLCKNTLASGFLREPGVPVINERLFDWVTGEPHHRNLKTLWHVGEELTYVPKLGRHFDTIDVAVEFAGITFKLDGVAFAPKEPWSPTKDIQLPLSSRPSSAIM